MLLLLVSLSWPKNAVIRSLLKSKAEVLWYECLKSCYRPGIIRGKRPLTICLSPWRSWRGRLGERRRSGIVLESRFKPLRRTWSRQPTHEEYTVCTLWAETFCTCVHQSTFPLWLSLSCAMTGKRHGDGCYPGVKWRASFQEHVLKWRARNFWKIWKVARCESSHMTRW